MKNNLPKILIGISIAALILGAIDFMFKQDIFGLAGTQWVLISIALAVYAMYAKDCNCGMKNNG